MPVWRLTTRNVCWEAILRPIGGSHYYLLSNTESWKKVASNSLSAGKPLHAGEFLSVATQNFHLKQRAVIELCLDVDFRSERAVHRALVGDFEQTGALFRG